MDGWEFTYSVASELQELFSAYGYSAGGRLPIQEFDFEITLHIYMDDWKMGSIKKGDKFPLKKCIAEVIDIKTEQGEYVLDFLIRI